MLGISPLYPDGILHEHHIVTCMSYDLPISDDDQLDLPRSLYARFYVKLYLLYPNEDMEIMIQTKHERLNTFYATNALPEK